MGGQQKHEAAGHTASVVQGQVLVPVYLVQDSSSLWNSAVYTQGKPSSVKLLSKHSQTYLEVNFHGDSNSSEVDNDD